MSPTTVQPPDPSSVTPTLDISVASREQLKELLPYPLGRYQLLELIGEGGMARVFRAVLQGPAGFQKMVAVKLLKASIQYEGAGAEFMQEAVYAGRLNHPNVVDVYELNEEMGCPYIAMEWVDGEPLQSLIDPDSLMPPSVILDLSIALLNGLDQAHSGDAASKRVGMLHRDLKPSNIIVSRYGVPKLVDFGIAAQLDQDLGQHWPKNGMAIGTVNWMSPEQLLGQPLDERSDLFSLGLVIAATVLCFNPVGDRYMYKLLKDGRAIPECLLSVEEETALDEHLPGLGRVVAETLSRDVERRPRNARVLRQRLQDLRRLVGHRPTLTQWMRGSLEQGVSKSSDLANETTWVAEPTDALQKADTVPPPAGNIPTDRALFVGRSEEFSGLVEHLKDGKRLVTLVGTGGAGKTRLSRRVANHFSAQFSGGAWFVDLSEINDEDGIIRAVAQSMNIKLPLDGEVDTTGFLAEQINARGRLLIVLDNFEQVVAHAVSTVGRWLSAAPSAQFLVTTREALSLPSEVRVPLNPLSQDEAIELLQALAKGRGGTWGDDDATLGTLGEIVDALDRLPLAIELAAARARVLSPSDLRDRLAQRFKLLRSDTRGQTDRQATLHSLIDWSWKRLEPWEQSTLAQLSCFRGGFSMEAAEAMVDISDLTDAPWTMDVIGSLLDKSLIHTKVVNNTTRMFMYLSIREFAKHRLTEDSPGVTGAEIEVAARTRHAAYFSGLSPIEATGSLRAVDPSVRRALYTNFDNLLAAARTAPQPYRTQCAMGALEVLMNRGPMAQVVALTDELLESDDTPKLLALRLHVVRATSLRMMGRMAEARATLDAAVACAEAADASPTSDTLLDLNEAAAGLPEDHQLKTGFEVDRRLEEANLLRMEGKNVEAERILKDALTLCSPTRTPILQAKTQHALGWLQWSMSNATAALANLREARAAYKVAGQKEEEATSLSAFAYVLYSTGKTETALGFFREALALLEESEDPTAPRHVLSKLANLERDLGDHEKSLEHFDRAIALRNQVGDVLNAMIHRIDRSRTLIVMECWEEAETELAEVLAITRQREAVMLEAMATGILGELCLERGRLDEAEDHLRFAYGKFEGKIPSLDASMGMSLALTLARRGQTEDLDDLTLGKEQFTAGHPLSQLKYRRDLAEIRLAQSEPAAAYRHIGRAREVLVDIEDGGDPKILAELVELERRIIGS